MLKSVAKKILPAWARNGARRIVHPPRITYNQDGLKTIHNADFMSDPRFARAYDAGAATGSWRGADIHWRAFVVCWAASHCSRLEGDFVECGVNKGGLAITVAEYADLKNLDKRFFLLDTYEGFDEKYLTAAEKKNGARAGGFESCFDAVVKTFQPYGSQAVIIKGPVPDTLSQITAERIAYLSIDMNCVVPEIAAAEILGRGCRLAQS